MPASTYQKLSKQCGRIQQHGGYCELTIYMNNSILYKRFFITLKSARLA